LVASGSKILAYFELENRIWCWFLLMFTQCFLVLADVMGEVSGVWNPLKISVFLKTKLNRTGVKF